MLFCKSIVNVVEMKIEFEGRVARAMLRNARTIRIICWSDIKKKKRNMERFSKILILQQIYFQGLSQSLPIDHPSSYSSRT